MMLVHRIGAAGPDWDECDLEGKGAKATGGRWNLNGIPVVYASSSIALAVLETVVHLGAGMIPMNRYVIEISIPDGEFAKRRIVNGTALPDAWNSRPVSFKSQEFGSKWINGMAQLVMEVPSVIVPFEANFLINPLHPAASGVSAKNLGPYIYDPRVVKGL